MNRRIALSFLLTGIPLLAQAGSVDAGGRSAATPAAKAAVTPPAAAATPYVRTGRAEKRLGGWYHVEVPLGLPPKALKKLAPAVIGAAKARGLDAYEIEGGVQVWAAKDQTLFYWTQGTTSLDCEISFGVKSGDAAAIDAIETKLLALHEELYADATRRSEAAKAFE